MGRLEKWWSITVVVSTYLLILPGENLGKSSKLHWYFFVGGGLKPPNRNMICWFQAPWIKKKPPETPGSTIFWMVSGFVDFHRLENGHSGCPHDRQGQSAWWPCWDLCFLHGPMYEQNKFRKWIESKLKCKQSLCNLSIFGPKKTKCWRQVVVLENHWTSYYSTYSHRLLFVWFRLCFFVRYRWCLLEPSSASMQFGFGESQLFGFGSVKVSVDDFFVDKNWPWIMSCTFNLLGCLWMCWYYNMCIYIFLYNSELIQTWKICAISLIYYSAS